MNWNKSLAALMIASFVFVLIVPVTPATSPSEGLVLADGQTTMATTHICTLITGDVLEITKFEDGRYLVSMASNKIFRTVSTGEETYIIPEDVEQLIGETLDMELFNIDYLLENGYCDSEIATIPVIVEYSTNPGRGHAKINTAPGLLRKIDFETIYASSADVAKEEADEFAEAVFYTEGGLEGVDKIWLDRKIKLSLDDSVPGIGAPYAWDQGYDGTGIKIAIIDTGIWKDHPDLAGKVIAEKDFSDDNNPTDLYGHGTHCAGIAAANGALKGVAPEALLINAKALNKEGFGFTSWIMAAWEWAAAEGANVFSMSFGGEPTDGTAPCDIALNMIVDKYNVVAVAAAANSYNYYTTASPAAADKAIAVGATKLGLPKLSVVYPEDKDIQANLLLYSPKPPVEGLQKPIVYVGYGSDDRDFEGTGVEGKIALIKRGDCTLETKVENSANAGAVAAIIFNNVPWNFLGSLSELGKIPAVSISGDDGNYLLDLLTKGEVIMNLGWDIKAAEMADFSSRGPRLDEAIKPDIVAPGVAIKSTVPTYPCELGDPSGYNILSGTSMSTPHVAGATALLLQKHPDWKPMQIRDALMSTARIDVEDPYIFPKPIADIYAQGSGNLAVDSAIVANVVFEPAKINLGAISRPWLVQTKSFAIRNYGDNDVMLELTAEKVHCIAGKTFDIATLDKYTVTIPAGGIEAVTLTVDLTAAPTNIPLGGRIIAKNPATGEEIHAIFGIYKKLTYDLTVKMINPEGAPWANQTVYVFDAESGTSQCLPKKGYSGILSLDSNGEVTVSLPPAIYNVVGSQGWTKNLMWPTYPVYWLESIELPLYEDKSIVLDARETEPITLNMKLEPTVPSQSWAIMQYERKDGSSFAFTWLGPAWRFENHVIPYVPPPRSGIGKVNMMFRFEEIRGTPEYSPDHPVQKSPVVYDLIYTMLREITTPMVYTVDETTLQQMALIKAKHFSTDINRREHMWGTLAFPSEFFASALLSYRPYIVPIERDEYLTPDKAHYMQHIKASTVFFDGEVDYERSLYWPFMQYQQSPYGVSFTTYKIYKPGEREERTWLEQPMKPWTEFATRTGNKICVRGLAFFGFTDVSLNFPFWAQYGMTIRTEVYQDDELIWKKEDHMKDWYYWEQEVTPEEANYRIEVYTKNVPVKCDYGEGVLKPYWTNYSTETFTTIKFKSKLKPEEGTSVKDLPIINLNYKIPGLELNNAKKVSGKDPLSIYIIPEHLDGMKIDHVRFWYSYDDGLTWTEKPVKLSKTETNYYVVQPDPQSENYISIKTLALDVEGNTIQQTIMRAFFVTKKP